MNAAAEDVVRQGGGKVFVALPPQEGGQLLGESLRLHLAETAERQSDDGVRFILASGATLQRDKSLGERWQRGELSPVGFYSISAKHGVRKAPQASSAVVLLQVKDVPPPVPAAPQPDRLAQLLTLLSVLMTAGVGAWAIGSLATKMKGRTA